MTRRTIITGAAALALTPAVAATAASQPFFAARDLPIGIQLYALAPDLDADFDGTLRRVAAIGYRTVELAGLHGRSATAFRASLDAAGLTCRSIHVLGQPQFGPAQNLTDDLAAVAADAGILGAANVVMPLFLSPHGFGSFSTTDPLGSIIAAGNALTADDYAQIADFLNTRGATLQAQGLRLGYHNHNFEFARRGDATGLDILLRRTDPAVVTFELDIGWAAAAGVDVIALFAAHPGRFTQAHIKDIAATTPRNTAMQQDPVGLGHGIIDWPRVLPAAYRAGVRGCFVEQEPPFAGPRIDAMAANYRYLAELRT